MKQFLPLETKNIFSLIMGVPVNWLPGGGMETFALVFLHLTFEGSQPHATVQEIHAF